LKQIIQSFKTGDTILEEIPAPVVRKGALLIQSTYSLVSLGTEKMLVEFGKSNLISKARQQPDKVKQVLDKVKSDGLMPTLEAVFNKLEQPLPLGYCNVGKVIEVGEGVSGFSVGDRVASNGQHAEFVCIPQNLVVKIPENVSDEEASFTVIGSIGLQGIRLLNPTMGETIVVFGLGLIGLLTAELLVANGCQVIGIELDNAKIEIAKTKGISCINPTEGGDIVSSVMGLTNQIGADGVIITASAKTDEIISNAAKMSRKRGRIILVGVIGLNLSRAEFYEKELSFQVSCSYGPGRYDENYEQRGIDYPLPFVRWTEKRNFETILQAISTGKLNVKPLITEIVDFDSFQTIYGNMKGSKSIASLLKYNPKSIPSKTVNTKSNDFSASKGVVGIIGAGNFTKMTLLPFLAKTPAKLEMIASAGGVTGTALAKKYNFTSSTTDSHEITKNENIDLVMITTRHNQHAKLTIEALNAGKNVFVEKPLALNVQELESIKAAYENSGKGLTVGFNRRFSPHAIQIKRLLGSNTGPINIIATMNAGFIPENVWIHDMAVGGGRIVGEACHFIDLITYLSGSLVDSVCMNALGNNPKENTDNASILLKYKNGTNAIINYFSNGSKAYSKERLEVYFHEKTIIMDNFRKTEGFGIKGFSTLKTSLDKGHEAQFKKLVDSTINGGTSLIPFDEIYNTTLASFAAIESLKTGAWVKV
jgi:predicted dehydrogenase/threonine dehydrogenase-like Zn-dependent dehydrogenase